MESSGSSGGNRFAAAAAEISTDEWEQARPIANRLLAACWPNSRFADLSTDRRRWLAQVAILAVRHDGDLLAPVLLAVKQASPKSPQRFVGKILADVFKDRRQNLDAALTRIVVPDSLISGRNGGGR